MQYHEKLQQLASADIKIPAIFKPIESLAMQANPSRRQAQRILFEASVISPVVEANRDRLINSDTWSAADSERLAALIRLEGAVHLKGLAGYDADYPAEDFYQPLIGPTLKGQSDGQDTLAKLMQIHEWTYFRGGAGKGMWPAAWLSRGQSLRDNQPIARGWDSLDRAAQASQGSQKEAIEVIKAGRLTIERFNSAERAFWAAVAAPRSASWSSDVLSAWSDLSTRRNGLDKLVADLKAKTGVTGEVTLEASYRAAIERAKGETGAASQLIRAALQKQKAAADAAAASSGAAADFTLYKDLERRLAALDSSASTQASQLMSSADEASLGDLDITTLMAENGAAVYGQRYSAYNDIMQIMAPSPDAGSLIGRLGEVVSQQAATLAAVRERSSKYTGYKRQEFIGSLRTLQEVAATQGVEATIDGYRKELDKAFPDSLGYPLGSGAPLTAEPLKSTRALLAKVRADASAAANLPADVHRPLDKAFKRLEQMAAFASALAGADGAPVTVKLVLPSDQDQEAIIAKILGSAGSKQAITRSFKSTRVGDRGYPLSGLPESLPLGNFSAAAALPRLEFFTTVGPKSVADATVEPGSAWGALRLLQQSAVRRADGKEWDTVIRLNNKGTELVLPVTLSFEQGLPPADQWPAR